MVDYFSEIKNSLKTIKNNRYVEHVTENFCMFGTSESDVTLVLKDIDLIIECTDFPKYGDYKVRISSNWFEPRGVNKSYFESLTIGKFIRSEKNNHKFTLVCNPSISMEFSPCSLMIVYITNNDGSETIELNCINQ